LREDLSAVSMKSSLEEAVGQLSNFASAFSSGDGGGLWAWMTRLDGRRGALQHGEERAQLMVGAIGPGPGLILASAGIFEKLWTFGDSCP